MHTFIAAFDKNYVRQIHYLTNPAKFQRDITKKIFILVVDGKSYLLPHKY